MRGAMVKRVGNTILIPLPVGQWRIAGDGSCDCPICKKDGTTCYWDTLAVSAIFSPTGNADLTWTVHAPELHSVEMRRIASSVHSAGLSLV
jgi:hypothetical protein